MSDFHWLVVAATGIAALIIHAEDARANIQCSPGSAEVLDVGSGRDAGYKCAPTSFNKWVAHAVSTNNHYGVGWASDREVAIQNALRSCEKYSQGQTCAMKSVQRVSSERELQAIRARAQSLQDKLRLQPQPTRVARPAPGPRNESVSRVSKQEAIERHSQTKPAPVAHPPTVRQSRATLEPTPEKILVPLREPNPDEKWIVFEEDGTIRAIEGIEHLYIYYALKGIGWPYKERTPPKPIARNTVDQVAPRIPASKGARHGYGIDHTRKLSAWAEARNQLLIFRARNVASMQYDADPDFTTKPERVSLDKDGLWVSDEGQSIGVGRSMSDLHTVPAGSKDTFRNERGREISIAGVVARDGSPIKIDGRYVIGDFDLQIVVEKKGANRIYENVLTDPKDEPAYITALNEWLNAGVDPARQKPWVRHGPEATFKGLPPRD